MEEIKIPVNAIYIGDYKTIKIICNFLYAFNSVKKLYYFFVILLTINLS